MYRGFRQYNAGVEEFMKNMSAFLSIFGQTISNC